MVWAFDGERPIYLQVMEHMKVGIISGELPPGSRISAVRDLAAAASVNPNTMQKALGELEREGLLYTQRTNGRFVTEDSELIGELRYQIAKDKLTDFVQQMHRLGYSVSQLSEMLTKVIEEENSNGK